MHDTVEGYAFHDSGLTHPIAARLFSMNQDRLEAVSLPAADLAIVVERVN